MALSASSQERNRPVGSGVANQAISGQLLIQKGLKGYQARLGLELGYMLSLNEDQNYLIPVTIGIDLFSFGLGSHNNNISFRQSLHYDLVISTGIILASSEFGRIDKPFISFSHPFNSSLVFNSKYGFGFGSRLIFGDFLSSQRKTQRSGFLNANLSDFQIVYNNDGAWPLQAYPGDGFDRWWTAGLTLHYETNDVRYKVSYSRYTGYKKDAYEFASLLGYKRTHYSSLQTLYNRGEWALSALSKKGVHNHGVAVTLVDFPGLELQDLIHFLGKFSFHPTVGKKNIQIGYLYDYNDVQF